jgi:hypothetical protein
MTWTSAVGPLSHLAELVRAARFFAALRMTWTWTSAVGPLSHLAELVVRQDSSLRSE